MRNKKGILILLTLALLCGCFTGCKKDKEDSKETTEAAQTTAVSSATLEAATSTETTTTYAQLYPEEDYDGTPDYTIPANDESSVPVSYVRDSFHPNAINGVVGYYAPVMEIPVDCTMISDSAFENNPIIETVSFQNPYTQLGTYSFSNCSSLSDLTLPTKLEVVTESAFQDCTQLQSLEIPESVTEIQKNAFYGCTALSYLTFQEGLKTIGDTAFYGCSKLSSVYIPDGVTEIGDYAFGNCAALSNVHLPESITKCGLYPFSGDVNVPVEQQRNINVYVKEGSWMDKNYDMVFQGTRCTKVTY